METVLKWYKNKNIIHGSRIIKVLFLLSNEKFSFESVQVIQLHLNFDKKKMYAFASPQTYEHD